MDRDPIIDTLHGARLDAGITQQKLADRIGCTRNEVCYWEIDHKIPRLDRLRLWAEALGYDVSLTKREA